MKKVIASVLVSMFVVAAGAVAAIALATPAQAKGSTCWQVDCNVCCHTPGGGTVCTQRACV
jgi:hypothetical protein